MMKFSDVRDRKEKLPLDTLKVGGFKMSVIIKEAVAPLLIACNKREEDLATTILIV